MLDAALVRHWLQPDWQVPGVRAWCTTRAGQLSRPPYDGFNTASHVGDDPESVARCRRALADYFAWSRPPQWLRQVHGIAVVDAAPYGAKPEDGAEPSNYLIPKGKHINFNPGEKIQKGEYLLDGQPLPHDILRILGIKELTEYFVNQVQEVYRLQGVIINDKHIETILRQMLKKVEVKVSGDSNYLPGEVIDRIKFDNTNEKLTADGKTPAVGERVLMGITKASLQTESFISAASFQETTRVLTDAAIKGKIDPLNGLKENVIVGRLVPAGTGNIKNKWNKKALEDDNNFIAEQDKLESSEAAETPAN